MLLEQFSWKKEVIESAEPVLVDFWAEWCQPCRMMTPILESIAKDYKVCKVNVDRNQALSQACNVSSIPTLLIIHHGKIAQRFEGVTQENALRSHLERLK